MSSDDDLTLRILGEIRQDLRTTRDEIHSRIDNVEQRLDGRIDGLETRFEARFDRVERMIVESEIRTATAINGLAGPLHDVRDMFRDRLELRDRVTRCERDIDEIKHRIG
jgi:uncharacterized protein Yka (UPF0111/DUF47 family)